MITYNSKIITYIAIGIMIYMAYENFFKNADYSGHSNQPYYMSSGPNDALITIDMSDTNPSIFTKILSFFFKDKIERVKNAKVINGSSVVYVQYYSSNNQLITQKIKMNDKNNGLKDFNNISINDILLNKREGTMLILNVVLDDKGNVVALKEARNDKSANANAPNPDAVKSKVEILIKTVE